MQRSPIWIARRDGQDWRCTDSLNAIEWLTQGLSKADWNLRLEAVRERFYRARGQWQVGNRVPLFDRDDLIAWYVFQARAYASDRADWYEPEAYRLAPVFRRIGQLLPQLQVIGGAQERAFRLVSDGRKQPDDGFYELLVAAAYKQMGWSEVEFVPERPGKGKTHDLNVRQGRRRWAVECKRVGPSQYALGEREESERLAAPVHALSKERGLSAVIDVNFRVELTAVPDDYLVRRAADGMREGRVAEWSDDTASGSVRPVAWEDLRGVLACDDLYFGSSRMIEVATGRYNARADHSVDGDWTPSKERPFHAADVSRLSVVRWLSSSHEAARRKAKHFRAMVAKASRQLPGDRPGVVHVGYELLGGNGADALRDFLNRLEIQSFDGGASRLRWVYGNYMVPEHTTHPNESSALTETSAPYKVGSHATAQPLAMHQLFSEGAMVPGGYWLWPL